MHVSQFSRDLLFPLQQGTLPHMTSVALLAGIVHFGTPANILVFFSRVYFDPSV